MRRHANGFTLIELILSMALVAILSVIGLGSYTQATLKSRDTQRKNDLNQMAKAIELFNSDVGRYPNSVAGVMQCPKDTGEAPCGSRISAFIKNDTAIYMEDIPIDPVNGRRYYYEQSSSGGFSLYAALENTEDRDVVVENVGGVEVKTDWEIECGSALIICNYKISETGLIRAK